MSRIMRPILRRTVLAAGGTVMAAALARKRLLGSARAQQDHPPFQPLDVIRPHAPTPLPALSFLDGDGQPVALDHFRGHGVVLNLWATWCVPCVTEMPALDALARTLNPAGAPAGIQVLTVSLDHGGADAVRPFFAAHGIRSLPVLLDPHSTTLSVLGLDGIPVTLLIDRQGREVARLEGPVDWATPQAAALVERLVA